MTTCTHPRNLEDASAPKCRTCYRVRSIVRRAEREQQRINERSYSLGQRIAAGLA